MAARPSPAAQSPLPAQEDYYRYQGAWNPPEGTREGPRGGHSILSELAESGVDVSLSPPPPILSALPPVI